MSRPKLAVSTLRTYISGQSIVTLDSKTYYLGPHHSPEAWARFAVLIAEFNAGTLADVDTGDVRAKAEAPVNRQTKAVEEGAKPAITHVKEARRILKRDVKLAKPIEPTRAPLKRSKSRYFK